MENQKTYNNLKLRPMGRMLHILWDLKDDQFSLEIDVSYKFEETYS
ncbi:hypothetical protein OAG1_02040 [Agarivorans sp. OAG1]|nr:hypothetical protein OAG1_02040 [Agarivorans sp. OAG1]